MKEDEEALLEMVDKYRYGVIKVKASLMDVRDSQRFALKRVG